MTAKNKHSKFTILLLGILILLLSSVLIFCLSKMQTINRRMNESATANLLSTTQVISDTIKESIENDYESLSVVGTLYLEKGVPDADLLGSFCKTMGMDWIGVLDSQGNGVDFYGNSFNIHDYNDASSWNLQEPGYSDAYIGRTSGRQQITIWVPVYKNGSYFGTVLGNVIVSQYYSANSFTFYDGAGRTYIFNKNDGRWILKSLGTDGAPTRQGDIYSLLEASQNNSEAVSAFKETVAAGKSGVAMLNFNSEPSYLCFMPMPSSPGWYITTVIARKTLLLESSEVQKIIGGILGILCLTLVASAVIFALLLARRTKMKEVHYREALFANISANMDSAFIIYDKTHMKTAFVSDNIERLLGLNREWIGENAGRLFDWCHIPQDDPQRNSFLAGTLAKPAIREVCVENELGEKSRTIKLELIPADLGHELAVLTDITADKEIQRSLIETMEQANAASNAKNEFFSGMSHDLRTPINGIMGMTSIAATYIDDQRRVLDCLNKINQSSSQLLSIINEVLDMAQIESGRIEAAKQPFNIAELLQDVLNINYPSINEKNHTVKVHIHMLEHEKVIGDAAHLTRIATNLISNAIKYTPPGGSILLALKEKAPMIKKHGCYELTVQDNGMGMSADFQEKLFRPFEREEDVRIGKIQGTGLGMSIVKRLVESMMGSIEVESQKGVGTTLRVTVNLLLDQQVEEPEHLLAGLPVLVVDSDADNCSTVTDILCSIGMKGECTDSGSKAVDMVADRHQSGSDYLAVLIDRQLSDMDGIETARQIRLKTGPSAPVIILTAYEWGGIETEALESGVDAFLSKPIYLAKLLHQMTEIVNGQREPAQLQNIPDLSGIPGGKRALLVEDNDLNREIALEFFGMMGVEADSAHDGTEAVNIFTQSPPHTYDIVLMDIHMPKMNGYEATKIIRTHDKTVPIVAMTAATFEKDRRSAFEAGMNDYISKPVSIDKLSQIIKRYLSIATTEEKETRHAT